MKKCKYFISILLSTILLLTLLPIPVFAAVHDETSEYFTRDYFDWKDLKVTTDDSGNITGVSTAAWYNYGDASTIAGRGYGFYIVEKDEDKILKYGSRNNLPLDVFDGLMEGVGTRIDIGVADSERKWLSFSLGASDCAGMSKDKEYNIWFWTRKGDNTYNTFESLMGTMTSITINRYVKNGGGNSEDTNDYTLDSTVDSMNIIGQKLSAVWKTYKSYDLKTALSNHDELTQSKKVYNLYFYVPGKYAITDGTTDTNGSITVADEAVEDTTVTVTTAPAKGYQIKSLTAYKTGDESTKVALKAGKNGTYTFTMPGYEVTVVAEFEKGTTIADILPDDFPTSTGTVPDDAWENSSDSKMYVNNNGLTFGSTSLDNILDDLVTKDGDNYTYTNGSYKLTFVMDSGKLKSVKVEGSATKKDNGSYLVPHTHTLVKVTGKAPTREASGWKDYYKCECGALFEDKDGKTPISDLNKWKAEGGNGYLPKLPTPPSYTVTFNMGGHGTQVPSQTIEEGDVATEPAAPSEDGYTFDGWYTDSECTSKFDFDTAITKDTDLYAKWILIIKYAFEKNDILTWQLKSTNGLNYVVHRNVDDSKSFSLFTGIQIDGADVSADNYDASSGSLKLYLKPAYLNTLKEGSHTLKVFFEDGAVSISFKIKPLPTATPEPNGNVPATGEAVSWTTIGGIGVLAAGVVAAVLTILSIKKRREV